MVKVNFYYLAPNGNTYKKTLSYVNPNVTDEIIYEFVQKLNDLTTNQLGAVYKLVNDFLDNSSSAIQEDDVMISDEEIRKILAGEYVEVYDSDGITEIEINKILNGEYEPVEDENDIPQSFFDELFDDWEG